MIIALIILGVPILFFVLDSIRMQFQIRQMASYRHPATWPSVT